MRFRRALRFWLSFWRPDPGTQGERLAARFLRRQGYRILARNLRSRQGEIDLVAEPPPPNQRILVIVEVKTRQADSHRCHRPEWRVNHQKQQRLIRLAAALRHHRPFAGRPIRFDVLGVDLSDQGPPQIRHHPGAFQSPW